MAAILDHVVRKNLERAPFRERPERSKIMNGADTHRKSCHIIKSPGQDQACCVQLRTAADLRVGGDVEDSTVIQSLVGHCNDADFFQLNEMGSF